MEKDYSLLRPFDLEAAKRGEAICWQSDGSVPQYFSVTAAGNVVANFSESPIGENLWGPKDFRMKPLCWVEGKPVYKGDGPLFIKETGKKVFVSHHGLIELTNNVVGVCVLEDRLTWTPPKVKREGWGVVRVGKVSATREEAESILKQHGARDVLKDAFDGELRVVRIEWEEPAGSEGGALAAAISSVERHAFAPAADGEGWIEWGGGDCPVDAGTLVDVRYRDGQEVYGLEAGRHYPSGQRPRDAGKAFWSKDGMNNDIVAYRVVQDCCAK